MGMTRLSVALSSCTDLLNALRFWNTVFSNRRKGSSVRDDEQKANFPRNQVDVQKYLYNTDTPNEAQNNQAQQHQQQYNPSKFGKTLQENPNVVKQLQKGKSVPNMQELQKQREVAVPQPFNSQNIHTAVGESVDH
jgi:deoxyribodipyrimidine photolyase